jgi:hypothetical protein
VVYAAKEHLAIRAVCCRDSLRTPNGALLSMVDTDNVYRGEGGVIRDINLKTSGYGRCNRNFSTLLSGGADAEDSCRHTVPPFPPRLSICMLRRALPTREVRHAHG